MSAPLFKQISREEFNKLSLQDRLVYMRALMADLRKQFEETKRQLAESKKALDILERNHRGGSEQV